MSDTTSSKANATSTISAIKQPDSTSSKSSLLPAKPGAPEVKAAPSVPYQPKPVKQETSITDEPKPSKAAALVEGVGSTPAAKPQNASTTAGDTKSTTGVSEKSPSVQAKPETAPGVSPQVGTEKAAVGSSSTVTAPKAKAIMVAPTSAAAVMVDGKKAITTMERVSAIGSALLRGAGAKAEQPKAKPKAKVADANNSKNSTPPVAVKETAQGTHDQASPKIATNNTGGVPSAERTAPLVAPPSVLQIVSGAPIPAQESLAKAGQSMTTCKLTDPPTSVGATRSESTSTSKIAKPTTSFAPARSESTMTSKLAEPTTSLGPARGYAAVAAPFIPPSAVGADGTNVSVPKEGPAAVAVGRAATSGQVPLAMAGTSKPTAPIGKKFQICFVTSEVAPFSKTGGLGEAMDGLPVALAALGHRVMVIAPRYDQYKEAWDTGYQSSVSIAGEQEPVRFFHAIKQKVDYVFVDHPTFLERVHGTTGSKLYGPEWGKDFADNQARFAYFCKASLLAIQELALGGFPYGDDCVVVCNDWHSSLVPMFIHAEKSATSSKWATTKTAFLCHNAVFQGRFEYEESLAKVLGLPESYIESITFKMPLRVGKYNEKVKCVNTMAAGLIYSDRALTVSPSYAMECARDPDKGVELEDLFAAGKVTGILNGVKEGVSPMEENFVTKAMMTCGTFSVATASAAKEELKIAYQAQNSLPATAGPLMCFVGRLDAQKGYDLLLEALIDVLEDTEMQVVIVGAGRDDLVAQTKAVAKKFPSKFYYAGWMGPERYALVAACDFTLLPSRWEPCGLVQMEAMRVGTCPIVAPTGGLKDTVEDGLNGLWTDSEMTVEAEIDEESVESLARALRRASKLFIEEPSKMVEMKKASMAAASEFTWSNAALQYEAVFEEIGTIDVLPKCAVARVTLEADTQVC